MNTQKSNVNDEAKSVSEEEWKKKLTPEQYNVLREKGTEAPFTGKFVHTDTKGMFTCAGCGSQLFSSDVKFDSGTGWPSFSDALPGAVAMRADDSHGMHRTEVTCARCGGHLGHLFDDGPKEAGGKRFCINSCAIEIEEGK